MPDLQVKRRSGKEIKALQVFKQKCPDPDEQKRSQVAEVVKGVGEDVGRH